MAPTYNPEIFDVPDLPQAKHIILTPEGSTTEQRWETETPYVADIIGQTIHLTPTTIILDYGCGIGRLAKELINRHQCFVIGIDISAKMLELAQNYVQSDRFIGCSPAAFDVLVNRGLRVDAAISIWVLQHCQNPVDDITRIQRALRPNAGFFVLNNVYRAVPTVEKAWVNDGINIKTLIAERFDVVHEGRLPADKTTASLSEIHFWLTGENSRPPEQSNPPDAE